MFSCIFHSLVLNEILNEIPFSLSPHFSNTFSRVWTWEPPSSRSTMVLLSHYSLVYTPRLLGFMSPNEVPLYPFLSMISQIPSHSPFFTEDIGLWCSPSFISILTPSCNVFADDPSNTSTHTIPKPSGADCLTITKYFIALLAVASLLKVYTSLPCWIQFKLLVLVAQLHFYPFLS